MRLLILLFGCATTWHWAPVESIPKASQYPDAPAVLVQDEIRYEMVIPDSAPSWSTLIRHQVIAIFSEAGFHYASMAIPLAENQSLRLLKARTIAPDGSVQEIAPEQLLDERVNGKHEKTLYKKFRFPGVKVGGLLEYVYVIQSPGVYWWLTHRVSGELPVVHHRAEIFLDGRIKAAAKAYLLANGFSERSSGGETLLRLDVRDVPASHNEALSPPWQLAEPWWAFRVRGYSRYRSDQLVYDRWTDVVKGLGEKLYLNGEKYFKGVSLKPPASCRGDRRCALEQALSLVRQRTSLSGFVASLDEARPLKEVLADGRANNFEKTLLLRAALAASGVESYYALAARSAAMFFDPDFPLPGQWDQLLLYVPQQPQLPNDLLIDPSCEACAAGQVPSWIEGRQALVINVQDTLLDGVVVHATFTPIKGQPAPPSRQHRELDATLDASGSLRGTLLVERQGREAVDWQLLTRRWLPEDWRKSRESALTARHSTARIDAASDEKCDQSSATCRGSLSWTMPGYAAVDGERLVVPLGMLGSQWDRLAIDKQRHSGLFIRSDELDEELATLHVPDGYVVEELPTSASLESPALEARLEVSSRPGTILIKRTLSTHAGHWDAGVYPSLALVLRGAAGWRHQTLTLRRR